MDYIVKNACLRWIYRLLITLLVSAHLGYAQVSCPNGDTTGVVKNGQTCSELVASSTAECYDTTIETACCGSCNAQNTGVEGCEFGDRTLCFPFVCATLAIQADCCDTCRSTTTTVTIPTTTSPSTPPTETSITTTIPTTFTTFTFTSSTEGTPPTTITTTTTQQTPTLTTTTTPLVTIPTTVTTTQQTTTLTTTPTPLVTIPTTVTSTQQTTTTTPTTTTPSPPTTTAPDTTIATTTAGQTQQATTQTTTSLTQPLTTTLATTTTTSLVTTLGATTQTVALTTTQPTTITTLEAQTQATTSGSSITTATQAYTGTQSTSQNPPTLSTTNAASHNTTETPTFGASSQKGGNKDEAIIGGTVGGLAGLSLITGGVLLAVYKWKQNKRNKVHSVSNDVLPPKADSYKGPEVIVPMVPIEQNTNIMGGTNQVDYRPDALKSDADTIVKEPRVVTYGTPPHSQPNTTEPARNGIPTVINKPHLLPPLDTSGLNRNITVKNGDMSKDMRNDETMTKNIKSLKSNNNLTIDSLASSSVQNNPGEPKAKFLLLDDSILPKK